MVPLVLLTVDIVPLDQTMGEEELRELSVPCLNHLKELKGSFDHNDNIQLCIRQYAQEDGHCKLTARLVMTISVGAQRAQHLCRVLDSYRQLFQYELPNCIVNAHSEILKFQ